MRTDIENSDSERQLGRNLFPRLISTLHLLMAALSDTKTSFLLMRTSHMQTPGGQHLNRTTNVRSEEPIFPRKGVFISAFSGMQ